MSIVSFDGLEIAMKRELAQPVNIPTGRSATGNKTLTMREPYHVSVWDPVLAGDAQRLFRDANLGITAYTSRPYGCSFHSPSLAVLVGYFFGGG